MLMAHFKQQLLNKTGTKKPLEGTTEQNKRDNKNSENQFSKIKIIV